MTSPGRSHPDAKTPDNSDVLAAFLARECDIDTILARLATLSAKHFNQAPDDITWANVGSLGSYLKGLRKVSNAAFHEGEHAARSQQVPIAPRPGMARQGSRR
jgi:hypothetical protein